MTDLEASEFREAAALDDGSFPSAIDRLHRPTLAESTREVSILQAVRVAAARARRDFDPQKRSRRIRSSSSTASHSRSEKPQGRRLCPIRSADAGRAGRKRRSGIDRSMAAPIQRSADR
jgi:hypothetical protein